MRTGRLLLGTVVALAGCAAALEVRDLALCDGPYGPIRAGAEYLPGEEVVVRYHIDGLTADERGHARFASTETFLDASGTVHYEDYGLLDLALVCGAEGIAGNTAWQTTGAEPAGDYVYLMGLVDLTTGERCEVERHFTILSPRFGVAQPRWFRDEAMTLASPCGGVAGSDLVIAFRVAGADLARANLQATVQLFDAFREPTMAEPPALVYGAAEHGAAGNPAEAALQTTLHLNAAGTFLLRVTATDLSSGREAVYETRLRVEPEGARDG